jgi:type II secretory pathway pseudopilin PulG
MPSFGRRLPRITLLASPFGRGPRGRALTLIEATVSVLVVGVMLVAALNTVGLTRTSESRLVERAHALRLAQDLMAEILLQAYADPIGGLGSFGPGSSEAATGNRSLFNDVDDYHGWSATPPQQRDGTPLTEYTGFTRRVSVDWFNPANLSLKVASESGVKRITVTVEQAGRVVVQLHAFRTSAWLDPLELRGEQ